MTAVPVSRKVYLLLLHSFPPITTVQQQLIALVETDIWFSQKIMAGLAGSLKSPRALFAGGAIFYFFSIWLISQQYHVTLLDKVRGGASSIKILAETGVKPGDERNGTLGVRADQRLPTLSTRAKPSSSLQKFLSSI